LAILAHGSRCFASLFTESAITYRLRHGFEQSKLQMAVVVQKMVLSPAAGILFTTDPISVNRKLVPRAPSSCRDARSAASETMRHRGCTSPRGCLSRRDCLAYLQREQPQRCIRFSQTAAAQP
jgi:Pyruvate phosphate dikinase, AMP/ATP-binding domain